MDFKRVFIIHRSNGENLIIKESDAIENAKQQERQGIRPAYKCNIVDGIPAGWLVWSTYEDGAGVVHKRADGKYILLTGWQGEFTFV